MNVVKVPPERRDEFRALQARLDAANRTMVEITAAFDAKKVDEETWQRIHHEALHEATGALTAMRNFNQDTKV